MNTSPQGAGIPVLKEKIACDCVAMEFIKRAGANAAGNRSFFLVLLSSVKSIGIQAGGAQSARRAPGGQEPFIEAGICLNIYSPLQ